MLASAYELYERELVEQIQFVELIRKLSPFFQRNFWNHWNQNFFIKINVEFLNKKKEEINVLK